MSITEAVRFMKGQDRRHRQDWERSRMLAKVIVKVMTGSDYDLGFPWDNEGKEVEEHTPEQIEELKARARAMEQYMNGR